MLAPFSEISSLTFQAFLPKYETPGPALAARRVQGARLVRRAQMAFLALSTCTACLGGLVPRWGARFFTADPAVSAALGPLALPLALSAALHGAVCSAEGPLLVRGELGFLGALYAASAVLVPAALLRVKGPGASLLAVWRTFVAFQLVRAIVLNVRVHLPRRAATEVPLPAS